MRIVLDDSDAVTGSDIHNCIHLTSDARIMDRDNSFGRGCDEFLQFALVEIESVGTNVYEPRYSAPQNERVYCGNESEGWYDYLVAGLDVEQERRHFQGIRTGCRKQCPFTA